MTATIPVTLVGGGTHALSLANILPLPLEVAGYVDVAPSSIMPWPYLGNDSEFLSSQHNGQLKVAITFVSGPDCSLVPRKRLIGLYNHLEAPVIVSPTAIVSPGVALGRGTQVFHRVVAGPGVETGQWAILNTGCIVEHGCRIGSNVFVGPGATLCGGVDVGSDTYIGAGAVILPGISIPPLTIIGAGAVLTHTPRHPGTYAGVPARSIKN